jgi:hypothetical protein
LLDLWVLGSSFLHSNGRSNVKLSCLRDELCHFRDKVCHAIHSTMTILLKHRNDRNTEARPPFCFPFSAFSFPPPASSGKLRETKAN